MLPSRSMMSIWTVSPLASPVGWTVGSPMPQYSPISEMSVPCSIVGRTLGRGRPGRPGAGRAMLCLNQLAAFGGIGLGEQRFCRDVGKVRVAVPGFAVGKGEFGGFDDGVNESRIVGGQGARIHLAQHGELLEQGRALAPEAALGDRQATVFNRCGVFVGRAPVGEIVGSEHALVVTAGGIEQFLVGVEAVDRFRDPAFIPDLACRLDLLVAVGTGRFGLLDDALVGRGQLRVAEPGADLGHVALVEKTSADVGHCSRNSLATLAVVLWMLGRTGMPVRA